MKANELHIMIKYRSFSLQCQYLSPLSDFGDEHLRRRQSSVDKITPATCILAFVLSVSCDNHTGVPSYDAHIHGI